MNAVVKCIRIPRKELAQMSIAMEQLSKVTLRDMQVVEAGKEPVRLDEALVDRFQSFKFWSGENAKILADRAQEEEAALYSADNEKKLNAYHQGRDAILKAYAKRDSRGNPIIIHDAKGPQYDIPTKKEPVMLKALDKFNRDHKEVEEITARVKAKLEEKVSVMLVCTNFRDIPIVVNASYMRMFDEILLRKPRLALFSRRLKGA
jgi:hypothetical protein